MKRCCLLITLSIGILSPAGQTLIQADSMKVSGDNNQLTYAGAVSIQSKQFNLQGNRLRVSMRNQNIEALKADGDPVTMRMSNNPAKLAANPEKLGDGSFYIRTQQLEIRMQDGDVINFNASGAPLIMKIDSQKNKASIQANKATMNDGTTLHLTGNVQMTMKNGSILTGDSLRYNWKTGDFKSDGTTDILVPVGNK